MRRARLLRLLRRAIGERSGAAAVEFALIVPVLCVFLYGIWYTGWAIQQGDEVRHAVELGSRIYVTNSASTLANLRTAVSSHLTSVSISSVTLASTSATVDSEAYQHITWSFSTTAPIPGISSINYTFGGSVDVPAVTP
jgi:Flp pilus assembly protein TadG